MQVRTGPLIHQAASETQVNPCLLVAIIMQESSGDPWAVRYEPRFFTKYLQGKTLEQLSGFHPTRCSYATELKLRACSFGYMQILGETGRVFGYKGEFLTGLLDPYVNLSFGAKIFHKYLTDSNGDIRKALLRYNGGANKEYPKEVLQRLDKGEGDHLLYS